MKTTNLEGCLVTFFYGRFGLWETWLLSIGVEDIFVDGVFEIGSKEIDLDGELLSYAKHLES